MFTILETIWLVVSWLVYAVALVVTILLSLFVPMLFDAPGSERMLHVRLLAAMMLSAPVALAVTVIGVPLLVFVGHQSTLALLLSGLPVLHVLIFGGSFLLVSPRRPASEVADERQSDSAG